MNKTGWTESVTSYLWYLIFIDIYVNGTLTKCNKFLQAKSYRDYVASKKNLELLTEEDRFIYRLSYTERLATKLHVMYYIGNFFDNLHLITPVRSKLPIQLVTEELNWWNGVRT